MANKIDSNLVGLSYAEEVPGTLGVLPGTPAWFGMDVNSYSDSGADYKTTQRETINPSRQRYKGSVTDLDATMGFQVDFGQRSMFGLMPGFMFANWRLKATALVTALTTTAATVAAIAVLPAGALVVLEGFPTSSNNGLKVVDAGATATSVPVVGGLVANASPPADARVTRVGAQLGAGVLSLDVTNKALNSTTFDLTTLGVIPGEWIWVGGDAGPTAFATAANNGFYRVNRITAGQIVFDRAPTGIVTDAGTAKTIQVFIGHVIKNESDPTLIVKKSYTFERTYGASFYEYVRGCVANGLKINIKQADKVTVDLDYMGTTADDTAIIAGGTRTKSLSRSEDVFNSTSDFGRLRQLNDDTGTSLWTYITEMTINLANNVTPDKAVAVLGAFDMAVGDFLISAEVTAYLATAEAAAAIRNNASMSLDFALVKPFRGRQSGWLFDIPYGSGAGARRNVSKDTSVMFPMTTAGAAHPDFDHTLMVQNFAYLPNIA